MENEPEVIRKEMQETRSSLTEKIEALGQQLVGTVQDAREAMKETVGTVKEAVQDTVTTVKDQVTGTVSTVTGQVTGTVDSVKESLTGTVDSVKESVGDTVGSMKQTFDLEHHVINHPWIMVGGAVALGYVSGLVVQRLGAPAGPAYPDFPPPRPSAPLGRQNDEWSATRSAGPSAPQALASSVAAAAPAVPQFLQAFEPELQQLKGVAIGALFGVIRDMVQKSLPPTLVEPVTNVVDNLTTKMGGQPVQGHILDTGNNGR